MIIITSCFYSSVEHRAPLKVRQLVLFAAKAFTSVQLFFSAFNSFSTYIYNAREIVIITIINNMLPVDCESTEIRLPSEQDSTPISRICLPVPKKLEIKMYGQ
jgi:hypothetical protein